MKRLLILISILIISYTYSQPVDITLQQCFPDAKNSFTDCIVKTNYGYLIGLDVEEAYPGSINYHNKTDALIISIDSLGNYLWARCYGGSEHDGIHKIIPIDNNHFYVLARTYSEDGDIQNIRPGSMWALKIDSEGNIIWESNYGGGEELEEVQDAIVTPDGGLLMMCRIMHSGGDISQYYGSNDIWYCKVDSLGHIQWEKTLGNFGLDYAKKMILTNNSIITIGGHTESGGMISCPDLGNDGADVWITELDFQGNLINQHCYGGSSYDQGIDIIETTNGYVFVAITYSDDHDVSGLHWISGYDRYSDIWACKINNLGEIKWQVCLGGYDHDSPNLLMSNEDQGFTIFGNTKSLDGDVSNNHCTNINFHTYDIWMVKLDKHGNIIWDHCFGGENHDKLSSTHIVTKINDDNYVLLGQSEKDDGDVQCGLTGGSGFKPWFFEIKDCNIFLPLQPNTPFGPDTICSAVDSVSSYYTDAVAGGWHYQWQVQPPEAVIITYDSLTVTAHMHWAPNWEGSANIRIRSWNDCGHSAWSDEKTSWINSCLGIDESPEKANKIIVYPNPADDFIVVKSMDDNASNQSEHFNISIYNIYGKLFLNIFEIGINKPFTFNTSDYPSGIYIIEMITEYGTVFRKKIILK